MLHIVAAPARAGKQLRSGFITTYVPAVLAGNLAESVGGTHAPDSAYAHAMATKGAPRARWQRNRST